MTTISSPTKPSPIEVWLRQKNLAITCEVIHDDETGEDLDVDSLSMRGAQREMTRYLLDQGYTAEGGWEDPVEDDDNNGRESVRRFAIPDED
ncbi:hypothetical protein [Mycolicibacterium sphagni]|uniref:hypothetical protein n=1 Tax=Mycolicibacterium sphagni TaxID=1786 RepID=UPI0021F31E74|nr:hypothetical protein [Mycolicibacterium sphagni]MCV7177536.1 hypothetical protein [Mycolicibacterium sphagni]